MIVIYDTLGAYGGSHTLMLRMCQWMYENHVKSTIVCKDDSNTEIVDRICQYGTKIIRSDFSNAKSGKAILLSLMTEESIKVINFSWNNYLDVERIKKIYHLEFDNILYCIHPETFKKGIGFKYDFMRQYSKTSYRKIFEKMNENGSIISLDEVNIEESERYLESNLSIRPTIIRLPMYCEERDDKETIIECGFSSNTILAAARADFPYKGYILGLVDDYVELKKIYKDIKLEIVSSGDDYNQLTDKIKTVSNKLQEDILLHEWMDYEGLKALMRECKVFIGMGTSVFDAALQYKPSIVVLYNTYNNISDHFVAERPEYMTAEPGCEEPAIKRLEEALCWNHEEYIKQSNSSFQKVREIYDINLCMEKLVNSSTKCKGSILSGLESARHCLNHKVNSIRFRNRRFADYNDLIKGKEE